MPNALAYLALAIWPMIAFILFRMMSRPAAIIWTIVGGYLLLPFGVGIDLPMVPTIDKTLVPALSAVMLCFVVVSGKGGKRVRQEGTANKLTSARRASSISYSNSGAAIRPERRRQPIVAVIANGLIVLMIVTPFVTVLQNGEPVIVGAKQLPGLTVYDGFSMALGSLVSVLPFLLARRFLAGDKEHALLLGGLCLAALFYTIPALIEIRLSPQLSRWVYGFLAQSFAQAARDDGFRPVVFLQHGLWLAIFMAMGAIGSIVLWRQQRSRAVWLAIALWILLTLALSRSLGGLAIALALLPISAMAPARWQIAVAGLVAAVFVAYPMLRGAHLIPLQEVTAMAESVSEDRAQSLIFRLENEETLLARAELKPLAGWGGWGRSRVFDEQTGADLTITDGIWIIQIGSSGWLGYIAQFGLLTLPILSLLSRRRSEISSLATSGLCLVLAANLIDMIPNATLTPVTWMVAGALMGKAGAHVSTAPDGARTARTVPISRAQSSRRRVYSGRANNMTIPSASMPATHMSSRPIGMDTDAEARKT